MGFSAGHSPPFSSSSSPWKKRGTPSWNTDMKRKSQTSRGGFISGSQVASSLVSRTQGKRSKGRYNERYSHRRLTPLQPYGTRIGMYSFVCMLRMYGQYTKKSSTSFPPRVCWVARSPRSPAQHTLLLRRHERGLRPAKEITVGMFATRLQKVGKGVHNKVENALKGRRKGGNQQEMVRNGLVQGLHGTDRLLK